MNREAALARLEQLRPRAGAAGIRTQGMQETEGRSVDPRPTFGLGLTAGSEPNDYRIAILVQDEDLLDGARIQAIVDSVEGEAEVAYVGVPSPFGASTTADPKGSARPLEPGCSISLAAQTSAGTLGCFVEDAQGCYLLSNSHVVADFGKAPNGSPVVQPGILDGGDPASGVVATLARSVPVNQTAFNLADAAIARIESTAIDPVIPGLGRPPQMPVTVDVDDAVAKRGRTTSVTHGRVLATNVNLKINWPTTPVEFIDLILFEGSVQGGDFGQPGDSGSLIVRESDVAPVALLMAGGPLDGRTVIYAVPMTTVLRELSVSMV